MRDVLPPSLIHYFKSPIGPNGSRRISTHRPNPPFVYILIPSLVIFLVGLAVLVIAAM